MSDHVGCKEAFLDRFLTDPFFPHIFHMSSSIRKIVANKYELLNEYCFENTINSSYAIFIFVHLQREKKNLQDLNGVYVFNVADRDDLDRPTARLIKEFDLVEGKS